MWILCGQAGAQLKDGDNDLDSLREIAATTRHIFIECRVARSFKDAFELFNADQIVSIDVTAKMTPEQESEVFALVARCKNLVALFLNCPLQDTKTICDVVGQHPALVSWSMRSFTSACVQKEQAYDIFMAINEHKTLRLLDIGGNYFEEKYIGAILNVAKNLIQFMCVGPRKIVNMDFMQNIALTNKSLVRLELNFSSFPYKFYAERTNSETAGVSLIPEFTVFPEPLGRGVYGMVYKCEKGGVQYAAKVVWNAEKELAVERAFREVTDTRGRENVARIEGIRSAGYMTVLIMKLYHMTLSAYLGAVERVPASVMRDVVDGLSFLAAAGYSHGDGHPGNLMVGVDGRVAFIDFGLARPFSPDADGYHISQLAKRTRNWDTSAFPPRLSSIARAVEANERWVMVREGAGQFMERKGASEEEMQNVVACILQFLW